MSEMVERVARAIMNEAKSLGALSHHVGGEHSLERRLARAAIEAMKDEGQVTYEMMEAGRVALHAPENRHGAVLGAVFCAMIDAALKD